MAKTIHGMSHSRLYQIWNGMKMRCENPNAISYKRYGAKGVSVCSEWGSFVGFRDWALVNGYAENLTIERIDNNGNYEPSNCRWATPKEQQNNTSYNRRYTHNGETLTVMQWAEKMGVSPNMLYKRLLRGWDFEKALTTKTLRNWGK